MSTLYTSGYKVKNVKTYTQVAKKVKNINIMHVVKRLKMVTLYISG